MADQKKARVTRFDVGTLRKPQRTPQGFLRVDGHASRSGIFEYMNPDGTIRRELRPESEVFSPASLASYEGAPLTIGHPSVAVDSTNVKQLEVGAVTGEARRDGDHVAIASVIKMANAIQRVERGDVYLSTGYAVDLEETPGVDSKHGRYDAIQRNIVVNHLAIAVRHPRAGMTAKFRMDEMSGGGVMVMRADEVILLTSSVQGHQHTICLDGCADGRTSYGTAEGADDSHSHAWIRNADGTITIGDDSGHTHEIEAAAVDPQMPRIDDAAKKKHPAPTIPVKPVNASTRSGTTRRNMDPDKLAEHNATLEAALRAAEGDLKTEKQRADSATTERDENAGRIKTLEGTIGELQSTIAAGAAAVETEALAREKTRADAAEEKVLRFDSTFEEAVRARTSLMHKAAVVMGVEFRMDGMDERTIMTSVVKRLDSSADITAAVSDGEIRGRFLSLVDGHLKNARSQARVGALMSEGLVRGDDAGDEDKNKKMREFQDQWKKPLDNDIRANRNAQKGR